MVGPTLQLVTEGMVLSMNKQVMIYGEVREAGRHLLTYLIMTGSHIVISMCKYCTAYLYLVLAVIFMFIIVL